MDFEHPLYCASKADWREWLKQNHAKETEVWLLRYAKNSGVPSVTYAEALEEALAFGWIDGRVKGIEPGKSGIRFSPRKANSIWSKTNKDKAERLIEEGRMTAAGLATVEAAKKSGAWKKAYDTRKQAEMPEDLIKALAANRQARDNFEKFAPGYKNLYILWMNDAKRAETRTRRIAEIVARSAQNKKPGID